MNLRSLDVDAFLRRFTEGKAVLKLAKHKVVYAQGDRAETVYFIQKGRVKRNVVSVAEARGKAANKDNFVGN